MLIFIEKPSDQARTGTITIPSSIDDSPPIVSYKYTSTIASKVFNHKKTVSDIDFSVGSNEMSCDCSSSRYVAGHVVTGNLHIVENRHIRELLVKGPSYREQNNGITIILEAVRIQWARREHIDNRMA